MHKAPINPKNYLPFYKIPNKVENSKLLSGNSQELPPEMPVGIKGMWSRHERQQQSWK